MRQRSREPNADAKEVCGNTQYEPANPEKQCDAGAPENYRKDDGRQSYAERDNYRADHDDCDQFSHRLNCRGSFFRNEQLVDELDDLLRSVRPVAVRPTAFVQVESGALV